MSKDELIDYIKALIDRDYGGYQIGFAGDKGLSAAYLNDVLRGRREPGKKILDAVGVERVVTYRLKGDR